MMQLLRLVPADGDPRRCVAALVDLDPDGACRSSGRIILGGAEGEQGVLTPQTMSGCVDSVSKRRSSQNKGGT